MVYYKVPEWSIIKYRSFLPFVKLSEKLGVSQRSLATAAHLSRGCLRSVLGQDPNVTVSSLLKVAEFFGGQLYLLTTREEEVRSECSTVAVAMNVESDGFDSWKIHFMNFVDEFRKNLDPQLMILPPPRKFDPRLKALLASIVNQLCIEVGIDTPEWARKHYFLEKPWFVSGYESLKATALLESPLAFRKNNIFVQENFLERR